MSTSARRKKDLRHKEPLEILTLEDVLARGDSVWLEERMESLEANRRYRNINPLAFKND